MTKKRFRYWFNEDGEENISDNYNQFKTVDLSLPCGEQLIDILNELEREKEYWKDKALHKELIWMTEKRFVADNEYVMQNGEVYVVCGGKHSADVVATALNQLLEENGQLKQEKERYKRLSEIRAENINNRILSLKEFRDSCEDEKVKNALTDLLYSEVKKYDLAKENRELKKEVERLKCINKQLEERLGKDVALDIDCGDSG